MTLKLTVFIVRTHPATSTSNRPRETVELIMEALDSLESLQTLQRDLAASINGRIENVDRLATELEAHIADFRSLLDRNRCNEKSRTLLTQSTNNLSTLTIGGVAYKVSADFKDAALTVANECDLDEMDAAKLCLLVQQEVDQIDETLPYRAVLRFQTARRTLLDCFRLVLKRSRDANDDDDEICDMMQTVVRLVVRGDESTAPQQSAYWRKCVDALTEIEEFMSKTQSHTQAMLMTGQAAQSVRGEALQVQRMFLAQQHEALAAIMCYLIQTHYVLPEDFRLFLHKSANSDLLSDLLSHFAAVLIAGSSQFGSDLATSQSAALELHRLFADGPAKLIWKNRSLGAAAAVWWVAEYSIRVEDPSGKDELKKMFFNALDAHAFQYMLSLSDFYEPEVWHDPAKAGLVRFLLDSTSKFPREAVSPSQEFAQLTMQEMQTFIESMVSNMHGALRELKTEEDSHRRNHGLEDQEYEMHLERFLLIIAYAYQDDLVAAMDFWSDTESGLYGFLRWTSRRLPTPRVAAFCEMLRSLANGDKSAAAAHRFLLEDTVALPARGRRAHSLSWQQIFAELELYATSIRHKPMSLVPDTTHDPDILEAETPIMLEAYLRLVAHIVRNSSQARYWVLYDQPFKLHECLLQLAQSAIPAAVQACCFEALAALATDCALDIRDGLWLALDHWLAGPDESSRRPQRREANQLYLQRIASDAEVATAFINLLNTLTAKTTTLDELPFPDQLGTSRRQSGIDLYVDFVLSLALPLSALEQQPVTEDRMQVFVLRHACFTFVRGCISNFNEELAALEDNHIRPFPTYARSHPFARVMEYLFNDQVILILFQTARQNPDELRTLAGSSPLVQAVHMAISVINLVLEKQATYFDVVRPLIKNQSSRRETSVSNPAFASFEDVLLAHLSVVDYLAGYISCPHEDVCFDAVDLLKRMSISRKVSLQAEPGTPKHSVNRLVNRLVDSSEALQIELRQCFAPQELGLEGGALHLSRAQAILDLLTTSLSVNSALPGLAHCLLGFDCGPASVSVADGSLFSQGKALFHSISTLAILLPLSIYNDHPAPLQSVRTGCFELLSLLASSALAGEIVTAELQSMDFLPALQAIFQPIDGSTTWEGDSAADSVIWLGRAPIAIDAFLKERRSLLNLINEDVRSTRPSELSAAFILAQLDFLDIEIAQPLEVTPRHMEDFDAGAYLVDRTPETAAFDPKQIGQALAVIRRRVTKESGARDQVQEQQVDDEIAAIVASINSCNARKSIAMSRIEALEAFAEVASYFASMTTDTNSLLAMLQHILPRFDRALEEEVDVVSQLAKIVLMIARTTRNASQLTDSPSGVLLQEALSHAYRSALRAIQDSETDAGLRDICYRTCSTILELLSAKSEAAKAINERVVMVVAEDTFAGRGVTRISALLFLDSTLKELVAMGKCSNLLRILQKVNFQTVLVESSISNVAIVFRDGNVDLQTSLAYFYAAAAVSLRIAQIPGGAQLILNSGFIAAVQDSGLFSTDPDIGLDIDNTEALREFYRLLTAVLRILVAILVGRGPGDGGTMQSVRKFLSDNRMSMTAVFKLLSRQEKEDSGMRADAQAIADELGRLIYITGFLEVRSHHHECRHS